jgi:hypothetical protein
MKNIKIIDISGKINIFDPPKYVVCVKKFWGYKYIWKSPETFDIYLMSNQYDATISNSKDEALILAEQYITQNKKWIQEQN